MTRRVWTLAASGVTLGALVLLATGCEVTQDPEMVPPTRTITASPSPRPAPVPSALPVGDGNVSPSQPVWAQDNTLHVGKRQVDLSPVSVDSLAVVAGGVFILDRGELRFTDLSRVSSTGLTGATRMSTSRDGRALRVEMAADSGPVRVLAYDVRNGLAVPLRLAPVATAEDRLGTATEVVLKPGRRDTPAASTEAPLPARVGPGGYGVIVAQDSPLAAFDSATRQRLPLKGVAGNGFQMLRWTSAASFYGLALESGRPSAVLGCELRSQVCRTFGAVDPGRPVVFESGA